MLASASSNIFGSVDFQWRRRFIDSTIRRRMLLERTEIAAIDGVPQAFLGHISALRIISDDSGDDILGSIFDENVRDWQDWLTRKFGTLYNLATLRALRFNENGVTIITRRSEALGHNWDFQVVNGSTSHVIFDRRSGDIGPARLISTQDDAAHATNRLKPEQLYAPSALLSTVIVSMIGSQTLKKLESPMSLIGAFGAMFLDEPTGVTRNYKSFRDLVGEKIYKEGDKFEPYYVASYSAYKLEFYFAIREEEMNTKLRVITFL